MVLVASIIYNGAKFFFELEIANRLDDSEYKIYGLATILISYLLSFHLGINNGLIWIKSRVLIGRVDEKKYNSARLYFLIF